MNYCLLHIELIVMTDEDAFVGRISSKVPVTSNQEPFAYEFESIKLKMMTIPLFTSVLELTGLFMEKQRAQRAF